jgi:hypothetical protein
LICQFARAYLLVDLNELKEIRLLGGQFSWANNLLEPTYEKLDRVLVTAEWDQAFPLVVVTGMNRDILDHVPLLLKYGAPPDTAIHLDMKIAGWKGKVSWI